MANKTLFNNRASKVRPTNTRNKAGGRAYKFTSVHALCQYAVTGTFHNVFYATAKEQLTEVQKLVSDCDSETIAKVAIYAHEQGKMKDVPAYLLAVLTARRENELLRVAFPRVITNVKMLLNYVQFIRSGVTGRRSFGSAPKKLIQNWLNSKNGKQLMMASIGHANPSLADVIKMARPKPQDATQDNMFAYLIGKNYDLEALHPVVQQFEAFKKDNSNELPDLPFRALTNCGLTPEHWKQIAQNMPWNTLRMNLNMLHRNGVFNDVNLTQQLAAKLADAESVRKFNAFPYQLLTAYQNTKDVPVAMQNALQDALEVATENVPDFGKSVAVAIDISGSMGGCATGAGVTTARDVAALMGACVLRKNQTANVFGWDTRIHTMRLNPRDTVITNCRNLSLPGGGTDASVGLQHLNNKGARHDVVIYVSDNQSWYDPNGKSRGWGWSSSGTTMAKEWEAYRRRVKGAKLVCIDVQPYGDSQVPDDHNVLNIGGFSDAIWPAIDAFVKRGNVTFTDVVNNYVEL